MQVFMQVNLLSDKLSPPFMKVFLQVDLNKKLHMYMISMLKGKVSIFNSGVIFLLNIKLLRSV